MDDTRRALLAYEAEYVRCGYMYSGEMSPEYLGRETGLGFDRALDAIKALVAAGVLERRQCEAWTYELVPAQRARLISAHRLSERWQVAAPHFYPNDARYGEVPSVMRLACSTDDAMSA